MPIRNREFEITITNDGKAFKSNDSIMIGKTYVVEPSDDQKHFPTEEGWIKIRGPIGLKHWQYFKIDNDGSLKFHHFCSIQMCSQEYEDLVNYCCNGVASKKEIGESK